MWWIVSTALGAPPQSAPAPAPVIEVVPTVVQGMFRLTCDGRDGDRVFVDGWEAGVIPLETELAEGQHEFRVEGAKGRLDLSLYAKPEDGQTVVLDLGKPPEDVTHAVVAAQATVHQPPPDPAPLDQNAVPTPAPQPAGAPTQAAAPAPTSK